MLLRFKVKNYKSLYREQQFSMVPLKSKAGESALPVALIYGPNASGKSNLVSALSFMFSALREPDFRDASSSGPEVPRFRLAASSRYETSTFEVDVRIDGVRYNYGFVVEEDRFVEEWLYAFPHHRRVVYFEKRRREKIQFGDKLRGKLAEIEKYPSWGRLYLPIAGAFGNQQLEPIWRYFADTKMLDEIWMTPTAISRFLAESGAVNARTIDFLTKMNTGVFGQRLRSNGGPSGSPETPAEIIDTNSIFRDGVPWIELGHRNDKGEIVYFSPSMESSGTARLLLLLDRVFEVLDRGQLLIIDEIDLSLHTRACEAIFQLFTDPEINTKGAQLIATTHDTNLICSPQLGRDQIWFAEKDATGATEIYPLSDFKVRENDNFERGYLRGRFGALPFAGDPSELFRSMRVDNDETV